MMGISLVSELPLSDPGGGSLVSHHRLGTKQLSLYRVRRSPD
jgi:hypothetical protein